MVDGREHTFGVSGRLYKSNVLLYDHQTESLWSQLMEKAIAGPAAGKRLVKLPATRTSWKSWRQRNPNTLVLSTQTGYGRNYAIDPYEGYYRIGGLMFPVGKVRQDLAAKERVLGIEMNQTSKAYPLKALAGRTGFVDDMIGGAAIKIEVNAEGEIVSVRDDSGKPVAHIFAYWFAWQAFHPKTEVYND